MNTSPVPPRPGGPARAFRKSLRLLGNLARHDLAALAPQSHISLVMMTGSWLSWGLRVRGRGARTLMLAVLLAILLALGLSLAAPGRAVAACGQDTIATARAGAVIDGRTFKLADGREVRLAAIEVPRADAPASHAAGKAAQRTLAQLIAGHRVTLKRVGTKTDRYGRLFAIAFVQRDGSEHAVQHDLVAAGHARVSSRIGDKDCATDLLAAEQAARAAKLGLWADPYYGTKQAEAPADILAERGRFALVEGKVLSVRASGGTIYVNFGRRWSRDFAVTISRSKRSQRAFAAAGLEPKALSGRRIRVRGWIEVRGGPRIYAARPEQIEILGVNSATEARPK